MTKTFILKNQKKKKIGEISYSKNEFKIDIFSIKEKKKIENLLNKFLKQGFRDLGEIILKDPIKPGDHLFLNETKNQLARKGYILIEKICV